MLRDWWRTITGGGGGAHCVLRVNEPKKIGARSARARSAAVPTGLEEGLNSLLKISECILE
jgi:hypothetical protein